MVVFNHASLSVSLESKFKEGQASPPISSISYPKCTETQLEIIRHQLPSDKCQSTQHRPWKNKCSFSVATRCPDAIWVPEFFRSYKANAKHAIYVGCNKAMDAINTLRMISNNQSIDKEIWKDAFFENQTVEHGHCKQEFSPQYGIPSSAVPNRASVYCIEAMPGTAMHLKDTADKLGLQESLLVTNTAMSSKTGSVYFPKVTSKVGTEGLGMNVCARSKEKCQQVPLYTLDSYLDEFAKDRTASIDLLSIDVEGFDYKVLLGGVRTLQRVRYMEFEYNWKGAWRKHTLSEAIGHLKSQGFGCYFAGTAGHIWRITDCFLDYYDLRFWSNVACVNWKDPVIAPMARHMEGLFQKTLQLGTDLQIVVP